MMNLETDWRKQDRAFRRRMFLQEAAFWLVVAVALGAAAWLILTARMEIWR